MNSTYWIIEDWIDQLVVSKVTKIKLITHLLISLSDLFPFKLIRTLLTHLSAIEIIYLIFLQPKLFHYIFHYLTSSFS